MKELNKFNIDIFGLKNGPHTYQFSCDKAFFDAFENSLVDEGQLNVAIELEKSDTFIKASFGIEGSIMLTCDRTLEPYKHPLNLVRDIIYKFGEEEKELDDHVLIITKDKQRINVAQLIYEFVSISIPMKKLHPDIVVEEEDEEDEGFIVFQSGDTDDMKDEEEDQESDPRWESLKKLKDK